MTLTIYHNPRCSKSRATLELIEADGVTPVVVPYLEQPPDVETLRSLQRQLGVTAQAMVRTKEAAYSALGLSEAGDAAVLAAICAHPELLERPIVSDGRRAVFGRPPENVRVLLEP